MSHMSRSIIASICLKSAKRASSFMHSRFGARTYNEGNIPLLASSHHDSIDEKDEGDLDMAGWEYQAALQRPYQEKLWDKECDEREKEIASTRLMHTYGTSAQQARRYRISTIRSNSDFRRVQIQPPATNVAKSQRPSLHSAKLSTASYATGTASYEQQTGIVRDTVAPGELALKAFEVSDGSSTSSLQRRGAVKRKANPLFARPTYEDFAQASCYVLEGAAV